MTVTVTKPQATLRELLATLKKKTGLFGEQVMRSNTVDDFYVTKGTNRNLLINGDFRISQRGDYTTATSLGGTYQLDRWINYLSNFTGTLQHTTVTLNGETRRAAKVVLTNSTSGEILLEQRVEPVNMIVGKAYTLSAWVRTTNTTIRFRVHNGSVWESAPISQFCPADGQWHKMTFTYQYYGPIAGYHPIQMYCNVGNSGEYYEFTDVQLEEGLVATPFERRLIGTELQLCQRYFEKMVYPLSSYTGFSGWALTSGAAYFALKFSVEKRATPTLSAGGNFRGQGLADTADTSSYTLDLATPTSGRMILSGSFSGTNGQAVSLQAQTANAYIQASSEL